MQPRALACAQATRCASIIDRTTLRVEQPSTPPRRGCDTRVRQLAAPLVRVRLRASHEKLSDTGSMNGSVQMEQHMLSRSAVEYSKALALRGATIFLSVGHCCREGPKVKARFPWAGSDRVARELPTRWGWAASKSGEAAPLLVSYRR